MSLILLFRQSPRRTPVQAPSATPLESSIIQRVAVLCIPVLLVGTLLIFVLVRNTSSNIERCFRSRLAVLSPHLSDREVRDLAASWILMRTRDDFDAINGRLKGYAARFNIVPLTKSLEQNQQGRPRYLEAYRRHNSDDDKRSQRHTFQTRPRPRSLPRGSSALLAAARGRAGSWTEWRGALARVSGLRGEDGLCRPRALSRGKRATFFLTGHRLR
jgi:hypothetical protein